MTNAVYRVHDDEWEGIMGEGQIREFAISQVCNCPDDFLEENIFMVKGKDKEKLLEVANKILNTRNFFASDLTAKDVELILTERLFDVEKLNIY